MERRYFEATELRFVPATGDQPPRVSGYAATFNTPSYPITVRGRKFVEQIAPGAFKNALAAGGNTAFVVEHEGLPLADTATRSLSLAEDAKGLQFVAELDPADPDAQRIIPKLQRGTLRAMSFAFDLAPQGDTWEMRDGLAHRTVRDVRALPDVSIVTNPAYPDTSIALRSLEQWTAAHPEFRDADEEKPQEVAQPKYAVGALVVPNDERFGWELGKVGQVTIARAGAPPYYAITFTDPSAPQMWYAEDELSDPPSEVKLGDRIAAIAGPYRSLDLLQKKLRLQELH